MSDTFTCPTCTKVIPIDEMVEGYCPECTAEHYEQLWEHEYYQRRWNDMCEQQRQEEINRAMD